MFCNQGALQGVTSGVARVGIWGLYTFLEALSFWEGVTAASPPAMWVRVCLTRRAERWQLAS